MAQSLQDDPLYVFGGHSNTVKAAVAELPKPVAAAAPVVPMDVKARRRKAKAAKRSKGPTTPLAAGEKLTLTEATERAMGGNPEMRAFAYTAVMSNTQARTKAAIVSADNSARLAAEASNKSTRISGGVATVQVREGAVLTTAGTTASGPDAAALEAVKAQNVSAAQSKLARALAEGVDAAAALALVEEGLALLPADGTGVAPTRIDLLGAKASILLQRGEQREGAEVLRVQLEEGLFPQWLQVCGSAPPSPHGADITTALLGALKRRVELLCDIISQEEGAARAAMGEWLTAVASAGYAVDPASCAATPATAPAKALEVDDVLAPVLADLVFPTEAAAETPALVVQAPVEPTPAPKAAPVPAPKAAPAPAPKPAPKPTPKPTPLTPAQFEQQLATAQQAWMEETGETAAPAPAPAPAPPAPTNTASEAQVAALVASRLPLRPSDDWGARLDSAVKGLLGLAPGGATAADWLLTAASVHKAGGAVGVLKTASAVHGASLLVAAARSGSLAVVDRILKLPGLGSVLLEAADASLATPAAAAVEAGHSAVAQVLLEGGASVEAIRSLPVMKHGAGSSTPVGPLPLRLPMPVLVAVSHWFNAASAGDRSQPLQLPGTVAPVPAFVPVRPQMVAPVVMRPMYPVRQRMPVQAARYPVQAASAPPAATPPVVHGPSPATAVLAMLRQGTKPAAAPAPSPTKSSQSAAKPETDDLPAALDAAGHTLKQQAASAAVASRTKAAAAAAAANATPPQGQKGGGAHKQRVRKGRGKKATAVDAGVWDGEVQVEAEGASANQGGRPKSSWAAMAAKKA